MLKNNLKKLLPKRDPKAHKGSYGKVLIIAGSEGMSGAAILCSRGSIRSGAGLTYLAVPKNLVNLVDLATPEVITLPVERYRSVKANAIAIGPGLGVSSKSKNILLNLTQKYIPLIIDADGINILAKNLTLLYKSKASVIITPHPGEMARLIKKTISYVQDNREKVAQEFAKEHECIVVLKGHKTIVAEPLGRKYINDTGNPGMASGGVGDVLTGMIAAFVAQGLALFDAAKLGVYIHGLAGDLAARDKGEYGLIASDLVERIPHALR